MDNSKTERTINAYNKSARKYDRLLGDNSVYKKKITEFYHSCVDAESNILDLGCGPGNNIQTLTKLDCSCRFTGVDLSCEFLNLARERLPQVSFHKGDIRQLSYNSVFDAVIASFCIVHLTDSETEKLIGDIARAIKTDGHLYLSFMEGDTSGFETTSFSKQEIFFNYFSLEFISKLLQQENLTILQTAREEYIEPDGSINYDLFLFIKKST